MSSDSMGADEFKFPARLLRSRRRNPADCFGPFRKPATGYQQSSFAKSHTFRSFEKQSDVHYHLGFANDHKIVEAKHF